MAPLADPMPHTAPLPAPMQPAERQTRVCRLAGFVWVVALLLASLLQVSHLRAQRTAFNENVEALLLDLKYNEAYNYTENYIEDVQGIFYRHHIAFLQAFLTQSDATIDAFFDYSDFAEDFIDEQDEHKFQNVLMAEVYFERALIWGLKKDYMEAINWLRKSYGYIQKQKKADSSVQLTYRLDGLYDILLASAPAKFHWILKLFGYSPNQDRGLGSLTVASKNSEMLQAETNLLYYYIERNLLGKLPEAGAHVKALYNAHPDKIIPVYVYAGWLLEVKRTDDALTVLNGYLGGPSAKTALKLPYFYYLLGKVYLYKQMPKEAIMCFDKFLQLQKGYLYRTDACYKKGLAYLISDNTTMAATCFVAATKQEDSGFDEDHTARVQSMLNASKGVTTTQRNLLRARLLYDGGYYDKAIAVLNEVNTKAAALGPDDKADLYYRYGRVYHDQKNYPFAKKYYLLATQQNAQVNRWMCAYGCYYIGQINETEANWHEARRYYELALGYDNYLYQNGLEQKARSGMERLKYKFYEIDK